MQVSFNSQLIQVYNNNIQFVYSKNKHYKDCQVQSKIMEDKLLKGSKFDQVYDPFESPPSLEKAENHRKATSLGKQTQNNQNQQLCPCCSNVIHKQQIPLNCEDEQLLFLGVGYPLFYKLTRYFGLIIFLIFMISGSGFYFLVTLNCVHECIYFFGVPIINLQMSGIASAQKTDVLNVVTAFAIFGFVMYIKAKIRTDVNNLDKKYVSADQYTIIMQNLPQNINQEDLIEFSKQKFGVKPVMINFAYNIKQLSNAYTKRQQLTIKLNKMLIDCKTQQNSLGSPTDRSQRFSTGAEVRQLRDQINGCDNLIDLYRQQKIVCHKIGTAFLTYAEQKTVVDILNKYEASVLKTFINKLLSPFRSSPLLFRASTVVIAQAPGPRQVIWQNLKYSFLRSVVAEILFVLIMIAVLFCTFKLQSYIVSYSYELRHKSERTKQAIVFIEALAMSLAVVVVNALLRMLIKLFAFFKKYYSYSSYHSAFCLYYSISYICNTCFTIYIVHGHRDKNPLLSLQQQNLLIYDIHLIMLANAFSQPLFKLVDPAMWFRFFRRKYIERIPINKNPYTQSYVNSAWEGYEIQIADNYQYIFRMLVITTWFAHSAPLGVVLSLLGMFIDYWVGKLLLLRYYKRPQSISRQIASPIIASLQLLPLVYICGVLQLTYKVSDSENIFNFLYQFLKYGITTFVIMICILGYLVIYKPPEEVGSNLKYDQIQSMFPYNYQTENPITKFKGQMKYLYGVLKRGTTAEDTKIIKQLLTLDLKNKDSFAEKQSMIIKIKRNNLKKLETLEASGQYLRRKRKNSTDSDTSNQRQQIQKD